MLWGAGSHARKSHANVLLLNAVPEAALSVILYQSDQRACRASVMGSVRQCCLGGFLSTCEQFVLPAAQCEAVPKLEAQSGVPALRDETEPAPSVEASQIQLRVSDKVAGTRAWADDGNRRQGNETATLNRLKLNTVKRMRGARKGL